MSLGIFIGAKLETSDKFKIKRTTTALCKSFKDAVVDIYSYT